MQKSRKKDSDSESEQEEAQSSRKRKRRELKHKESVLSKVDNILAPEKQPKLGARAVTVTLMTLCYLTLPTVSMPVRRVFSVRWITYLILGTNQEVRGRT